MEETKKDNHYRDFSNRTAINGRPLLEGQILVPVVLNREMRETLKPAGLNYDYAESWHFPHAREVVPVVFIPTEDVPGAMDASMKIFNDEAERYLKHTEDITSDDLSLDKFLEDIDDEDGEGFDPTGTTENEDSAFLMQVFEMLVSDLSEQDENMGKIIRLLADGFQKKEILDKVDLGKGKTQGYAFIEKAQKAALMIMRWWRTSPGVL